jgi:hypothetical protein
MKLTRASAAAGALLAALVLAADQAAANPQQGGGKGSGPSAGHRAGPSGGFHAGPSGRPSFHPAVRPNFSGGGANRFGPGNFQMKGKQFYSGVPHRFSNGGGGNPQWKSMGKPGSKPGFIANKSLNGQQNFVGSQGYGKKYDSHFKNNPGVKTASSTSPNAFYKKDWGGKPHDGYHHHDHYYRWYGPVFWPYFWGDYYSFAFWPYDYYDVYWGYGPDVIVWGAFWPYGEFVYDDYYADAGVYEGEIYRPYRRRAAASAPRAGGLKDAAQTCAGFAPGVSDLPIAKIEKVIDPTEDQRTALADLKTATARATEILKGSCSADTPLTPVSRLEAMRRRLKAMEEANEAVKGPLTRLYSVLSEEQKRRLASLASPSREKAAPAKKMNIAELCTSQAGFTSVPAEQISISIALTDAQKQQLEKLKAASAEASETLKASCPANVPETVDGRLEAAQQRVTALMQAVDTVAPAVRDFYASLTDEQKAALSIQSGQQQSTRG